MVQGARSRLPNEDVRAEFENYIQCVAQCDEWLREHPPTIEWGIRGVSFPPVNTPTDHPGVLALMDCVNAVAGPAKLDGFVAVSDIAWFAEAGIPSVLFGPGSGAGAHGVDERLEIDQLIMGTKILALMMATWCGYE